MSPVGGPNIRGLKPIGPVKSAPMLINGWTCAYQCQASADDVPAWDLNITDSAGVWALTWLRSAVHSLSRVLLFSTRWTLGLSVGRLLHVSSIEWMTSQNDYYRASVMYFVKLNLRRLMSLLTLVIATLTLSCHSPPVSADDTEHVTTADHAHSRSVFFYFTTVTV